MRVISVRELRGKSAAALRRARTLAAVDAMQQASVEAGTDRLSAADIAAEIEAVRKGRRSQNSNAASGV